MFEQMSAGAIGNLIEAWCDAKSIDLMNAQTVSFACRRGSTNAPNGGDNSSKNHTNSEGSKDAAFTIIANASPIVQAISNARAVTMYLATHSDIFPSVGVGLVPSVAAI